MLDWMSDLVDKFLSTLYDILPADPFSDIVDSITVGAIRPYLGYINYFFPVGFFLKCLGAFLASLAVYYLASIIMRWIKAVA